ncbi:VacB/RNase II family 3'-5' exoribonuclease [Rickettsiales bacterium LUAb2]
MNKKRNNSESSDNNKSSGSNNKSSFSKTKGFKENKTSSKGNFGFSKNNNRKPFKNDGNGNFNKDNRSSNNFRDDLKDNNRGGNFRSDDHQKDNFRNDNRGGFKNDRGGFRGNRDGFKGNDRPSRNNFRDSKPQNSFRDRDRNSSNDSFNDNDRPKDNFRNDNRGGFKNDRGSFRGNRDGFKGSDRPSRNNFRDSKPQNSFRDRDRNFSNDSFNDNERPKDNFRNDNRGGFKNDRGGFRGNRDGFKGNDRPSRNNFRDSKPQNSFRDRDRNSSNDSFNDNDHQKDNFRNDNRGGFKNDRGGFRGNRDGFKGNDRPSRNNFRDNKPQNSFRDRDRNSSNDSFNDNDRPKDNFRNDNRGGFKNDRGSFRGNRDGFKGNDRPSRNNFRDNKPQNSFNDGYSRSEFRKKNNFRDERAFKDTTTHNAVEENITDDFFSNDESNQVQSSNTKFYKSENSDHNLSNNSNRNFKRNDDKNNSFNNQDYLPVKMEDIVDLLESKQASVDQMLKHFKLSFKDKEKFIEILDKLVAYSLIKKSTKDSYKLRTKFLTNAKVPSHAILTISGNNQLGEKIAKFSDNLTKHLDLERYTVFVEKTSQNLNFNDKIIASIKLINKTTLVAKILKHLPTNKENDNTPTYVVGLVAIYNNVHFLVPLGRKYKNNFVLDTNNIEVSNNALVKAESTGTNYNPSAKLISVLSERDLSSELSLLTAHEYNIPIKFSDEALSEAENKGAPTLDNNRVDLRDIPLVTIDGADAKDFDDAVFVEKTDNNNYRALVAIADVSHYVEENSVLDREAKTRGNSTYLPGLVIPMLPEVLSNGWCSLNPHEDRACFVADMTINEVGQLSDFKFYKALMNSKARLTYDEVENALNNKLNEKTTPILEKVIKPLHACWEILNKAKIKRDALEIEANEYKVNFNDDNSVQSISPRERLISHQIIEELMIAANVSAAMFLKQNGLSNKHLVVYRVHDKPSLRKVDNLEAMLKSLEIKAHVPTNLTTHFFNDLVNQYKNSEIFDSLNEIILMSQSQAKYDTNNIGHFGLALTDYCHFTSPIRRYADLCVHRLIGKVLSKQPITLTKEEALNTAESISATERNSASAEYSAIEKITAKFLEDKINSEFSATISSITNAGIFITLTDLGAAGLIPMRTLGNERFNFVQGVQKIIGTKSKKAYKIGQKLKVILIEVNILRGLLTFKIK